MRVRWRWRRRAAPFLIAVLLLAIGVPLAGPIEREVLSWRPTCSAKAGGASVQLSQEQAAVATTIVALASKRGLPQQASVVALATAIQESDLRNLASGHLDSVGVFQQRPSMGWGTVAQLRTPSFATNAFYDKLLKVKGWPTMAVAAAAQAVQRSGVPDAYAKREAKARTLAAALGGATPAGLTCRGGQPKRQPASLLPAAASAELGGQPKGGFAASAGWLRATWLVGHAQQYGITSVTFAGKRWTMTSGRWTSPRSATRSLTYALR